MCVFEFFYASLSHMLLLVLVFCNYGQTITKCVFFMVEIRPAPHMDNLVSIYKSMEGASGVSMFVTQNVPVTKLSGNDAFKFDIYQYCKWSSFPRLFLILLYLCSMFFQ